jgi:photosynthetic reaction center H subunit
MQTGAITSYIDVAQLVLYAFWIFFAGLIIYIRREDKREGYPLESERSGRVKVQGFPAMPSPKTFLLPHGGSVQRPDANARDTREIRAQPSAPWPGAPLEPTGNPMLDGVGPASYAQRADTPDPTWEGAPKIVPLRVARDFAVNSRDPDPRGMEVFGADGRVGGVVSDVWVDQSEPQVRYLEVEVSGGNRRVLVPIALAKVDGMYRRVRVRSILAAQFKDVPGLRNPDQVTLLEEDRISAYYGGGTLYAEPSRLGPFL